MKKERPNQMQFHKVVILLLLLIPILTYAQPPHWKAGGNPTFGVDAVNAGNSILGPNGNFALNIQTNGVPRMIINNGGIGNAAGRVAMGNNLPVGFTPLSRLHLHQTAAVNAIRFTTDNMAGGNGFEVGYDATSNTQNRQYAQLNNRENTAMKFFT